MLSSHHRGADEVCPRLGQGTELALWSLTYMPNIINDLGNKLHKSYMEFCFLLFTFI